MQRPDVKHTTSGTAIDRVEQFGPFAIARVPARTLSVGLKKVAVYEDWLLGYIIECKSDPNNDMPLLAAATAFYFDWQWACSEARVREALERSIKVGRLVYS